jgi:hypothetical protein
MSSHEDAFRRLNSMVVPEEKKMDFSSKETWAKLKENLVQEKQRKDRE